MEAYQQTWKELPDGEIATIANATHLKLAGEKAYAAISANLGRQPVYVYDFCRQATQRGRKAAYHGLDTHYMFGSQGKLPGADKDDDKAAHFVQEYWCNFIKYGNPNGQGLPEWKPYEPEERNVENPVMRFTREMLEEKIEQGLKNLEEEGT
ncbi:MAG: carboxylesterase family protein [Lawsonibacter sp.]|nr:carboxylesterase family protein [Lawsonibacter sp.]